MCDSIASVVAFALWRPFWKIENGRPTKIICIITFELNIICSIVIPLFICFWTCVEQDLDIVLYIQYHIQGKKGNLNINISQKCANLESVDLVIIIVYQRNNSHCYFWLDIQPWNKQICDSIASDADFVLLVISQPQYKTCFP